MKIGLDAHSLGSQVGGNETYIKGLIDGLKQIDRKNNYTLYLTNRSAGNGTLKNALPNFETKYLWPANPFLRIPFATPLRIASDRLDVSLFQFVAPPIGAGKYILAIHDIIYEHYPEYFKMHEMIRLKMTTRYSAKRASHVVTCSKSSKNDLMRFYGIPSEKITVVYLGKNESFKPIRDESKLNEIRKKYGLGEKFILYVGNIQPRKNLARLAQAFSIFKKDKSIPHKLVIVGNKAWLYSDTFKEIRDLGLESEIIITGYVPDEELPLLYNAADSFVYPSLFEGFGFPVLEAMACGTPVITSNYSSLPEVAGDAARLVNPLSIDEIVQAMRELITNEALRMSLKEKGLKQAEKFTWQKTAEQMLELFERVGNQKGF